MSGGGGGGGGGYNSFVSGFLIMIMFIYSFGVMYITSCWHAVR